jgi:hypothetical protein
MAISFPAMGPFVAVSGSVCYHNTAKPQARNQAGHAVK